MTPGWEVRLSDPRRERRRRLLLVMLVLAVPAAFALGWYWPQTQPQQRPEDTQALLARLAEQDQELELLRQRLAVVGERHHLQRQGGLGDERGGVDPQQPPGGVGQPQSAPAEPPKSVRLLM